MVVRDERGAFEYIKCDVEDCPERSNGRGFQAEGLIQKGWHCAGGKHLCPAHKDQAQA